MRWRPRGCTGSVLVGHDSLSRAILVDEDVIDVRGHERAARALHLGDQLLEPVLHLGGYHTLLVRHPAVVLQPPPAELRPSSRRAGRAAVHAPEEVRLFRGSAPVLQEVGARTGGRAPYPMRLGVHGLEPSARTDGLRPVFDPPGVRRQERSARGGVRDLASDVVTQARARRRMSPARS